MQLGSGPECRLFYCIAVRNIVLYSFALFIAAEFTPCSYPTLKHLCGGTQTAVEKYRHTAILSDTLYSYSILHYSTFAGYR